MHLIQRECNCLDCKIKRGDGKVRAAVKDGRSGEHGGAEGRWR